MNSQEIDLQKFAEAIDGANIAMFTTASPDGSMHSRPMAMLKIDQNSFNGKLYFFSKKDTLKVRSIERDQHVNLSIVIPKQYRYISVTGRASLVEDKKLMSELWEPSFSAWVPQGLEDPDLSLIAVDIENADIWHAPENRVLQLVGSLKKKFGQPPTTEHLEINQRQ